MASDQIHKSVRKHTLLHPSTIFFWCDENLPTCWILNTTFSIHQLFPFEYGEGDENQPTCRIWLNTFNVIGPNISFHRLFCQSLYIIGQIKAVNTILNFNFEIPIPIPRLQTLNSFNIRLQICGAFIAFLHHFQERF